MIQNLTAAERVAIARNNKRPNIDDYIAAIFPHFFPMCGDRLCKEDSAILGGVACGIFGSMEQACGLVGTKDTFRPGVANAKCYEGGYRRYLKMYDCLSPLFGRPQG